MKIAFFHNAKFDVSKLLNRILRKTIISRKRPLSTCGCMCATYFRYAAKGKMVLKKNFSV